MIDIREAYEKYDEASDQVRERWEKLIGFGCGWFGSYSVQGDHVIVDYEAPRNGGPERDMIPIEFFKMEDEEKARGAWKEHRKEKDG